MKSIPVLHANIFLTGNKVILLTITFYYFVGMDVYCIEVLK